MYDGKLASKIVKNINYIKSHTLRCKASYRGGGIEIDAAEYLNLPGAKMTAYQNYLGGGMLGSVQNSVNGVIGDVTDKATVDKVIELGEALKQYFHELTNHNDDEWESASYEQNQARPESAY